MKPLLGVLAALLALSACNGVSSDATVLPPDPSALLPGDATVQDTSTTTEPSPPVVACTEAPFVPSVLPDGVTEEGPDVSNIPFDIYTTISGTSTSVWSGSEGQPLLVIVRGALPPVRWLETPPLEELTVRDTQAALGALPDGVWGVAWFEGPDRCDEYSIILYPPGDAETVRGIAESLVAGERTP